MGITYVGARRGLGSGEVHKWAGPRVSAQRSSGGESGFPAAKDEPSPSAKSLFEISSHCVGCVATHAGATEHTA